MAKDFTKLFAAYLDRSGLEQAVFAERAGSTQPTVALVLGGKRSPPPRDLRVWSDVLHLSREEAEEFIDAGESAHATRLKAAGPYVRKLERKLDDLQDIADAAVPFLLDLQRSGIELPPKLYQAIRAAKKRT
ncbi:helix-turn-helix transcriptional regulator [Methylibium sp.]|uniref:helix-turn-helix domain-containing protein n=1 Tax=Methylibium sp. TaxID=2067992 RepID=UPI00179E69F9|nr:helix-turn-helix transcriptional regulator [Methylibium sp.]MBA3588860.1 helix-turn-helix domain-containing protein [Methylibium sp.]